MGCGGDGGWIYREIMCCLNTHTHTEKINKIFRGRGEGKRHKHRSEWEREKLIIY